MFDFSKVSVHWFPSHMARGLQAMERKLRKVDIVVEVRDARIPFSSANPLLEELSRDRKRIVVFNKTDLADPAANRSLKRFLKQNSSTEFLMLDSTNRHQVTGLLEKIKQHVLPKCQEDPEKRFNMIVAGMPNVGKSTIINRLRAIGTNIGGRAVRIGGIPGITRTVSELVRISPHPKIYMLDTPGVLMPKITDPEVGLKIALCGGMLDRVVGDYLLAEYLLHLLCSENNKEFMRIYNFDKVPDRLEDAISRIAQVTEQTHAGSINISNTIGVFLRQFRTGQFGRFTLDRLPLN